ncbi:conserved domain protein [Streptococcus infantis X]|uniref:Conserved domain protein n=1 Tax=Streptococcus infantis X TaxID=997830 RepID=F9PBZ7_9STRE|nr:conserved domain protein [Streptococcus infantis X]
MKFIKKPYAYASILGLLLTGSFSYSMLKTFLLAESISTVATTNTSSNTAQATQAAKQQQ